MQLIRFEPDTNPIYFTIFEIQFIINTQTGIFMKKNLLLSALFFSAGIISSSAQITLTQSDVASIGDTIMVARDTTPNTISVGGTGLQTWDFTSLQLDILDVNAFVDPATTFAGSNFPNSNIAMDVNNGTQLNYASVDSASFRIDGFWGDPFGFGSPVSIKFNLPDKRVEFPSTAGNSFQNHMQLDYKFPIVPPQFGIDSAQIIRNSYSVRTIDAYGTMITFADSFDCLRQFSLDTIIDSIFIHSGGAWNLMPDLFLGFLPPELGYTSNPDTSLNYTYEWYANGEGMPVVQVQMDTLGITVTSASLKITDKVVAGLFSAVNPACNGNCDGSATVTAVSGYSPYTYLWDSAAAGQTTAMADSLCAGTYTVTITDNMGNSSSASITISEPLALTDSTGVVDAQCSTCPDGTATVSGMGGTAPYFYTWSGGQSSASITNVLPGTYYVTVTDDNGCSVADSVVVGFWAVGLQETQAFDSRFRVYPNPSDGRIFLVTGNDETKIISVYNVLGETIFYEKTSRPEMVIDLASSGSGVYFMKIEDRNSVGIKRINVLK